jgi:hypothetical protein
MLSPSWPISGRLAGETAAREDLFPVTSWLPSRSRDKTVIESKPEIYRAHPSCTCILLVRQDRLEITLDRRTVDGWRSEVLYGADELTLQEFGLTCLVKDVSATPLSAEIQATL